MKNEHIVKINSSLCIRCGLCKKDCPHGFIILNEKSAEITSQNCNKCGHCVAICPSKAISMSGFDFEPEKLTQNISVNHDMLMALIKEGRTIRHFIDKAIPTDIISKIIETGRYTPTAENKQEVSYAVLQKNKDEYEKIALHKLRRMKPLMSLFVPKIKHLKISDNFFFKGAPVVIVIKSPDTVDGALAASAMEIMAQSCGLGVLYSGFFTKIAGMSSELKRKLAVKRKEKIVATLVLGYPAVKYHRVPQREKPNVKYD